MLRKVQESPPPPHELVPGMNPSVSHVIARMMAKDPDERYPDHIELINALKEIETTTVSLAEILSAVKDTGGTRDGRPTAPPRREETASEGPPPSPRQLARWLRDGVAAARSGDRLLARTLLQKAVKLDSKNENALLWLVSVLDGPQERIPYLDRIREFNPASEKALVGLRAATLEAGVVEARKENRPAARRYLIRATELDPRSEPAWVWLARVADSPEEAANALRRALEVNPGNEMVRLWLERCQPPPAQPPRTPPPSWTCPICQAQAPRAASPCPACGALLTLADLAAWRGQRPVDPAILRQAVARLEILLRKKPGPSGHYNLALCYLNAKQFLQAARELQTFLRAKPGSAVLGQQAEELLRQLREAEMVRPTPLPSAAPDAPLGRTVLVVDDSATMRKVVARALEPYDYRVVEAADGAEALGLIDELRPDVVLLDLDLPGRDGCQVCRAIRARPQAAALPVIMLSRRSGLMDKLRARLAGSTQFLIKPFQPDILVQVVENACPRA
jgi:twitching motility two-component system response regulator PilG